VGHPAFVWGWVLNEQFLCEETPGVFSVIFSGMGFEGEVSLRDDESISLEFLWERS
jgi:hypothetical protein